MSNYSKDLYYKLPTILLTKMTSAFGDKVVTLFPALISKDVFFLKLFIILCVTF